MSLAGIPDNSSGWPSAVVVDGDELCAPVSLVVAHPGHELLAFGWLARLRPSVFIVTDGSGREAEARIEASARLLRPDLGTRASVFGQWTDRQLYDALREGRFGPFLDLFDRLVAAWCGGGVRTVICDAYERRILMHDAVELTVSAAVAAVRARGLEIDHVELPIYLGTTDDRPGNPPLAASLTMPDALLKRKIDAARNYESMVVRYEVDEFLRLRGEEAFRSEFLFRPVSRSADDLEREPKPEWENHGEILMQQGVYDRVIRLRDHVLPLAKALAPAVHAAENAGAGTR